MKAVQVVVQSTGMELVNFAKGVMMLDEWINKGSRSLCDINLDCKNLSYWGTGKAVLYLNFKEDWDDNTIKETIEDCFCETDVNACHVQIRGIEA